MSEAETMQRFETAFENSVAAGADPDEIAHALDRMQRRVEQLRIARGEGVGEA